MSGLFRQVNSANNTLGERRYDICRAGGDATWSCDTHGPAVNETIRILDAAGRADFTRVPGRRIMSRSFTLQYGDGDGPVIAALTTRGFGYEWKVSAPGATSASAS